MVTTTTASLLSNCMQNNKGSMLLYNSNAPNVSILNSSGGVNSCNTSTLEQYRLQLYNYALNMERLRVPPYTTAAMAAAAACALTTSESTTCTSGESVHGSNYTTSEATLPPYICETANGLIAAARHIRHTSTLTPYPSNRLALASMSLFPQRIFQPEEPKPQHSYIGLIAMAILSNAETKLVLSDIYQYILDNYPYFRTRGPGWRNSIRHNLSLNDCFIKSGRSANGKGHYWAIHPANMDDFRKGDFRRRKAQRKVRKHMGLAVDDNGTDSPSPPPVLDLTSPSPPSLPHHCSTITPIATTAHHLAAHSFGWRFTHHRPVQHNPHTTTHIPTASAASYMGQIFTYRPQQQKCITTHYAATAAAAAAMRNSCTTQKQQHQQHLIATTATTSSNHPQIENYLQNQKSMSFSSSSYHDKSEQRVTSSSTNDNTISELFSQKCKRQFDVASLLAPDNSQQRDQNSYLRNDNTNIHGVTALSFHNDDENPNSNDLDVEDIDVVDASDEDIGADFEQDDEDDSNCNDEEESFYARNFTKNSRRIKTHCEMAQLIISEDKSRPKLQVHKLEVNVDNDELDKNNYDDEPRININQRQHINNINNSSNNKNISILKQSPAISAYEFFTHSQCQQYNETSLCVLSPAATPANRTKTTTSPSPQRVTQILEFNDHNQNLNQLPLNNAHQLIGHYYDTYIAAAAAARINSSVTANIVGKID